MNANECHLPPGAGNLLDLGGLGVHFKIRGDQTGGAFAIVEHPMEAHVIVEPHVHRDEDELSYVVEGTIWARVGEREVEALPGSYVWKPRGVMHSFWNPGPDPARVLELISPAGSNGSSRILLGSWSALLNLVRKRSSTSAAGTA